MASFAVLLLLVWSVFGWAQPTAPLYSPAILIDGSSTVAPHHPSRGCSFR